MKPLPIVGYWVIPDGNTKLPTYSVPFWYHKYFMSLIFGWKWEGV